MAQPVYDHKPINRLTQVTTTLNLEPMAPRKTLISKKPAAKKVEEEEIVDEEEAEEVVVEADSKAEPEDDADDAEEHDEEADGDEDDEEADDDDDDADADDEDKEEDKKPAKKGKKSAAEPKKQREVSSAMPKIMVDAVFANLKEAGEVSTTKKDIKAICDCFIKTLVAEVMKGEKITLTNHMTFKRAYRKERIHKAPKSGIEVTKPEHYVMTMEVKPDLKKKFFDVKVEDEEEKPKKEAKKPAAKKDTKPAAKEAKKAKK